MQTTEVVNSSNDLSFHLGGVVTQDRSHLVEASEIRRLTWTNPWVKLVLCLWCLLCSTPSQVTILACMVSQKRSEKIMELILCFVRRVKELLSLSTLLSFCFFCPAFLCRCGEQPTSALFSGSGIWNLSKIYRSFHQALPRCGERGGKGVETARWPLVCSSPL